MDREQPPAPIVPRRTYLIVFGLLLAFTALTIGLAFVPMGLWNTPVALAIAATKALLILTFFMHLRHSTSTSRLVVMVGLVWLGIMLTGIMDDLFTRGWLPVPGK